MPLERHPLFSSLYGNDEMMASARPLNYVRANLQMYGRDTDAWKRDHKDAMACYAFQDHLQVGIEIFDSITRFDEDWRLRVFRGHVPHDASVEDEIRDAYQKWLQPCSRVEKVLRKFERLFGEVKYAAEFRSRHAEAQGILTPDDKFFANDSLTNLRDAAIDEHRRGDTQDVSRPGE